MKIRLNTCSTLLIAAILLLIYMIGGIIYFNATPVNIQITQPIVASYSSGEKGFKHESGLLLGRNWVEGNSVDILDDGELIFEQKIEAIRNAKKTITKETYNFWGDKAGTLIAKELAAAAERGVSVHFLMDYIGSRKASSEQIQLMKDAGVEVIRWRNPSLQQISRLNHRTHRKILVIDGETAFTGGVNAADNWIFSEENGGFKDYHYKITGPIVSDIQQAFSENWVTSTGKLLTGPSYYPELEPAGEYSMQLTSSHPREGQKNIRKMYLYAISSATESIRITSAYFLPDDDFLDAIADASKRGVHVRIILPGEKIDQDYFRDASKNKWKGMLEAGVEIYEYQPAMYHAKLLIVDDMFVSFGSANFDNRSFRINDEMNVNVLNPGFAAKRIEYFNRDLEKSKQYTLEMFKERTAWDKITSRATLIIGPHL